MVSIKIMKTLMSYLLCLSLIAIPFHAPAQKEPPPNEKDMLLLACVVVVIGAVVTYGLLQMCKKIPGPPPKTSPPPPGTNTNHVAHIPGKASWVLPRLQMPSQDIAPISEWQVAIGAFQTSADLTNWVTRVWFTNWLSDTAMVTVAADANGPITTNWVYLPTAWTNDQKIICDFGNLEALLPDSDRKFYRMVELP